MGNDGALGLHVMYREFTDVKNQKGLKLITLNAQSLRDKINYISIAVTGIDYIGVSETWLKPATKDPFVNIPGFNIFRLDRTRGKRGGVCCYVAHKYAAYTEICEEMCVSNIS